MSTTDDEVEQLLRRTRAGRERCNNRMALIGKNDLNLLLIIKRWGFSYISTSTQFYNRN